MNISHPLGIQTNMESFSLPIITILLSTFTFTVFLLLSRRNKNKKLPPGPPAIPFLGNLLWLRHSISDLEPLLRDLHGRYGPIVTLRIGSRTIVFVADRRIAHTALVSRGSVFSDRPPPLPASRFISCDQHNVNSAAYGPLWRLLRRNLISEILSPSRVRIFARSRDWVLELLVGHLNGQLANSEGGGVVVPVKSFHFSMFALLILMCYGEELDEKAIEDIEVANRASLVHSRKLNVFAFFPPISKYIFRKRWSTAVELRRKQKELCLPLLDARREHKRRRRQQQEEETDERYVYSYVDSLLDIKLPEEGMRTLTDDELVGLCAEFLNAGTDTTSTALQWIMAELVRNQEVQRKLFEEIKGVAAGGEGVKEEDLQRMPYLKAVILEGLRRHPPGHFVLPHAVTEEAEIEGYVIPKGASINFMVAEMGWDEKVWEEPMEFKPERFLSGGSAEGVDITGSREIKMMPFGVGRRICPGIGLAMLHLEYFVANLVREFEWKAVEGKEVDLSEKDEFTNVMKHPLRARLLPRRNSKSM